MAEVYIVNQQYAIEYIVTDILSFIWTERLIDTGDFELVIPYTAENVERWIETRPKYILFSESDRVMIAERFEFVSQNDGGSIKISGRSGESIFTYRVMTSPGYMWYGPNHPLVNMMNYEMLDSSLGQTRPVPGVKYRQIAVPPSGSWLPNNAKVGENLLTIITKALQPYNAGFQVVHDMTETLNASFITGKDLPHVVLSTDTGLSGFRYVYDLSKGVNTVYLQNETVKFNFNGTETTVYMGPGWWTLANLGLPAPRGLESKEFSKELSSQMRAEVEAIWNAYSNDTDRYNTLYGAQTRVLRSVYEENLPEVLYDVELDPNGTYLYDRDYTMGDKVYIKIPLSMHPKNAQVVEHTWSIDAGGTFKSYSTFRIED